MSRLSSSSFSVFLVDGYNVLAASLQGITNKVLSPVVPTHGLGDAWAKKSPTGVQEVMLGQDGAFFDDTTNSMHDAFKAVPTTTRVVCWATAGNTIGKMATAVEGLFSCAYEVLGKVADLTKANVMYAVSGRVDRGSIIQHLTAKTADWNTKSLATTVDYTLDPSQRVIPITSNSAASPSVVTCPVPHGLTTGQIILISGVALSNADINGERTVTVIDALTFSVPVNAGTHAGTGGQFVLSSTVNGGAGTQAISAFSGFTGFIGKIQHSPDDTTYADLITFTNVTSGPTAERKTVSGTVNRYLSFNGDVTGSGSITPFVMFARF
jgi:hypothetical protein